MFKMGVLAFNLLHMSRQLYVWVKEVKGYIDWLINRLIKGGGQSPLLLRPEMLFHSASTFPLAH